MNHGLDTDEQVLFYEQEFYALSNFSAFRLTWFGIDFDTAEHGYHWEKFNRSDLATSDIQRAIQRARSAHDAYGIAQRCRALVRPDWIDIRVGTMLRILRAKAEQHEYVRRKLLQTGRRELVENSWRDAFWGWGPDRDGQNMLGKLWMQVRAELQKESTSEE